MLKNTILYLLLLCIITPLKSQSIDISSYGVKPNTFQDVTFAVQKAIDECKKTPGSTLTFPKGRYDFYNSQSSQREYYISNTSSESDCPSKIKNIALLLEKAKDFTIDGNGSLFVFHGKTITLALDNSNNVTIKNLTFDFERPSMSELTIEKLDSNSLIASIHPDSKYTIADNKIIFYGEEWSMQENFFSILADTLLGTNQYSSIDPILNSKATEIEPFKIKFEGDFNNINYTEGGILSTRNHIRDHVGVFVNRSQNITFDNLSLHYMHGLGIISQFSENLTYQNIKIEPHRGRSIAAFADGMHFSGCKGQIKIDSCRFKGLHDDPINVHGTYLRIKKIEPDNKLILSFMHGQTYGFQPFQENDTIAFIQSKTLRKIDYAIVRKIEKISDREWQITQDRAIPPNIQEQDCVENITYTPSLHISNCRLEMTNTRGLLVTTPRKVLIENNYFYRTGMYAIMIAADANSWYESGAVTEVTIRNNVFDACAYNLYYDNNNYAISIEPENHEHLKNHWVHNNIRIENNTFKVYDNNLVLKARSTKGLYFSNNIIEHTDFVPNFKNRTKSLLSKPMFLFENCSDVKIDKNSSDIRPFSIDCIEMTKKDIKLEKGHQLKFR